MRVVIFRGELGDEAIQGFVVDVVGIRDGNTGDDEILRGRWSVSGNEAGFRCGHERHVAVALEEDAEDTSGGAVGDLVTGERIEDLEELAGDLLFRVIGKGAAEVAPAGESGPGEISGGKGPALGRGSVVAAEFVVAIGHAAALFAAGQDEGAFGSHGRSGKRKRPLAGGLFFEFHSIDSEYQVEETGVPGLLAWKACGMRRDTKVRG